MTDPLEEWFRAELAATMRPCRELPIGERVMKREMDAARRVSEGSTDVSTGSEKAS